MRLVSARWALTLLLITAWSAGVPAAELTFDIKIERGRVPDTKQLIRVNERNERLIEGLLVLAESDRGVPGKVPVRLDKVAGTVMDAHADLAGKNDAGRVAVGRHRGLSAVAGLQGGSATTRPGAGSDVGMPLPTEPPVGCPPGDRIRAAAGFAGIV